MGSAGSPLPRHHIAAGMQPSAERQNPATGSMLALTALLLEERLEVLLRQKPNCVPLLTLMQALLKL
eukprot:287911-Pelagomonas_calceolata.AAC.7